MKFGRYVVLSTAHVRCATGEQLTAWAQLLPSAQPIPVASTQNGWFLSTRPPAPDDPALPGELRAILAFGRDRRCDYILLDSDGDVTDALPVFPW
jgi:hypothetical protein